MPYANIGDTKLYYEIYGNELELTNVTFSPIKNYGIVQHDAKKRLT